MKSADIANELRDLPFKQQMQIVTKFHDELLAEVLEEMTERNQAKIIVQFDIQRAAEIIGSMSPDDAADLLHELPNERTRELLELMDEDLADDIRSLLIYPEDSAGGLMTTDVVVMAPDATVSEALAAIMREEISLMRASAVFVARPPLEVPTGVFIGFAYFQKLLRTPPHIQIGEIVDTTVEYVQPYDSLQHVSKTLAMYDQTMLPVVNKNKNLLGGITVDDVLDHMLPDNWRKEPKEENGG
jgi:Mg/Co/Ni transporter MgtE